MTTKKILILTAVAIMITGLAFASGYEGKVTDVKGDQVTVEITKGKASSIKAGDKVELEVKGGKAPKKGNDMLMGC
jgi:hypothetical protein